MFNILELALKVLDDNEKVYFTKEDIVKLTGINQTSVSNNIARLIKSGFLIKEEFRLPNKPGRYCKYRLASGDINELMDIYFK